MLFKDKEAEAVYVTPARAQSDEEAANKQVADPAAGQKWYQWFPPNTSAQEKKIILKMDFFILTYSCMAFFLKYLDQTNITNAYNSGMKVSLGLGTHNELSWFNTYYNIGTIIGSIPMVMLAGYFRPRYFLPLMDLLWSLCVLFTYKCTNYHQICAVRFLIGLFESSSNPGTHYMLGCLYRKHELMRRSGFFVISGVIGQATSAYIQSGLHSNMNGRGGLESWQWLFIFDFIIGIPVVIWGLIAIPELPHSPHKAWWLTKEEDAIFRENLKKDGKINFQLKFDLSKVKQVLKSWQFYTFSLGYAFWTLTCCSFMIQFFSLYLASLKTYSVSKINNIPTSISAVNFFFMITTGIASDKLGRRWPVCLFVGLLLIIATALLTSPSHSKSLMMAGYIMTGVYGCFTPILSGWCNISCFDKPYVRAVTLPFMIILGTVVSTPLQQDIFPSNDTPYYRKTHGYAFSLGFSCVLTLWTGVCMPAIEWYFVLLLLSSYYSKRQFYFETAEELYKLAISDFDLALDQRVEFLAKANVYCNLVEQFNLRQQAVELSNSIQNNLDIASIQLDVVERIKIDNDLSDEQKIENIKALSKKIVNISALYNEFVDPLEYNDFCLVIFKESEYRNIDEINSKWDAFFESLKELSLSTGESLPVLVSNSMIKIGKKVYDSEIVFPVATLFDKLLILLDGTSFSAGTIVEIFIKSGISYNMLYYYIKEMIEAGNGKNKNVLEQEMIYLIKKWWENDTRLKDVISINEISTLTSYSIPNDPINKYTNELGV